MVEKRSFIHCNNLRITKKYFFINFFTNQKVIMNVFLNLLSIQGFPSLYAKGQIVSFILKTKENLQ